MLPALAMAGGAIIGGAASLYGAHKAGKASEKAAAQQQAWIDKAIAELEKVGVPSIEAQRIALEQPELVFDYVPEMEQQIQLGDTAYEDINVDPELKRMQMQALTDLDERSKVGLTPEDEMELANIRRKTAGEVQGRDAQIMETLARRGMGGSGMELAQRMQASTLANQEAALSSERQAAMAFQAKQDAINKLLSGSSNVRTQDFGEQRDVASAKDQNALANFNAAMARQQRNIDAINQGRLAGEKYEQEHEYKTTNITNEQEMYNKGLIGDDYTNRLNLAKTKANQYTGAGDSVASSGANKAANTAAQWSAIGGIAGGLGDAVSSYYGKNSKKSLPDPDDDETNVTYKLKSD